MVRVALRQLKLRFLKRPGCLVYFIFAEHNPGACGAQQDLDPLCFATATVRSAPNGWHRGCIGIPVRCFLIIFCQDSGATTNVAKYGARPTVRTGLLSRVAASRECGALRCEDNEVAFFGDQQTASLFIYFCKEHRHACTRTLNLGSVRARAFPRAENGGTGIGVQGALLLDFFAAILGHPRTSCTKYARQLERLRCIFMIRGRW
jgi:hypothetical protein